MVSGAQVGGDAAVLGDDGRAEVLALAETERSEGEHGHRMETTGLDRRTDMELPFGARTAASTLRSGGMTGAVMIRPLGEQTWRRGSGYSDPGPRGPAGPGGNGHWRAPGQHGEGEPARELRRKHGGDAR